MSTMRPTGNLAVVPEHQDGRRWCCRHCAFVPSVRDGSFFSGSHLSLQQIIYIMYMWARVTPQDEMMAQTNINRRETMIDWCNFCRDE